MNNALGTWNDKLAEIWNLITQSPETANIPDVDATINTRQGVNVTYEPIEEENTPLVVAM